MLPHSLSGLASAFSHFSFVYHICLGGKIGALLNKPSHNTTTFSNYSPLIFNWHISGSSACNPHFHCLGIPLSFVSCNLTILFSVSVNGLFPSSPWDAGPSQTFLPAPDLSVYLPPSGARLTFFLVLWKHLRAERRVKNSQVFKSTLLKRSNFFGFGPDFLWVCLLWDVPLCGWCSKRDLGLLSNRDTLLSPSPESLKPT